MFAVLSDPRIYEFIPSRLPASVEALRKRYEIQGLGQSPDGSETWLNWILIKRGFLATFDDQAAGVPI